MRIGKRAKSCFAVDPIPLFKGGIFVWGWVVFGVDVRGHVLRVLESARNVEWQ